MESLDFSGKKVASDADNDAFIQAQKEIYLGKEEEQKAQVKESRVGGLFKSLTRGVKNITGGAVLTDEDLRPILQSFKTSLMSRNVAVEVADKLAESVKHSLV